MAENINEKTVMDNIFVENVADTEDSANKLDPMEFEIAPPPVGPPPQTADEIVQEFPHSEAPDDTFTSALTSPYVAPVAGVYDAVLNTGRFIHDATDWLGQHFDTAARIDSFLDSLPNMPEWPATRGAIGQGGRALSQLRIVQQNT